MVDIGIASLKEREELLLKTLKSLSAYPKVRLHLNLNEYSVVPDWIGDYPIESYKLNLINAGARSKFNFIQNGYCFTCDDDIEYPPSYIDYTIEKLLKYRNKAIVTYHGKKVRGKVKSYYKNIKAEHFQSENRRDHKVHIPGTGVMAWHSDSVKFSVEDFEFPNMVDIYAGMLAKNQNVDVIHVAHPANWFIAHRSERSIWNRYHRNDEKQTKLVNSFKWGTISS